MNEEIIHLSTKEVSDLLKVTPKTLYVWRKEKIGPPFKRWGKRGIRYEKKALLAWIKNPGDTQ
jgi:DNA-binding transcriptional MerR regulator